MAKPAKAAPEESEAPEKPKSKRLLLAVVGLLILGAIGGAAWYFLAGSKHDAPKAPPPEKPVYMDLESFVVNLQREESDQFLQIGISLKLPSAKMEEQVTEHLPEIRSRLLFLLSSKRPSELVPVSGKKKLAHDIAMEIDSALGLRVLPGKKAMHENAVADVNAPEKVEVAPAESAPVAAETEHGAEEGAVAGGVMEVLFTSFIIQ